MSDFQISDLIAMPMEPAIRIRVGPTEVVQVSQSAWELKKDDFLEWALALPRIDQGIGYRLLKPYTGNNGMLAKLAVALGDFAKIWRMYPSPDQPALWGRTHPAIMQLRKTDQRRRVPKPSAGDLDPAKTCTCCLRGMGAADSQVHDLVESDDTEGLCLECDLVCGPRASDCQLSASKEKRAQAYKPPETLQDEDDLDNVVSIDGTEFERYAKMFED